MTIKKGDKVKLDYEGRLENGEIFDTSTHGDHSHPLEFEVGSGQVIKGFDDAVIGMKEGEEKEFNISKKDAYGDYQDDLTKEFPKAMFMPGQEIVEGMTIFLKTPEGPVPVSVKKVTEENVTLDLNHPLAGKNLVFKIKVLEVSN